MAKYTYDPLKNSFIVTAIKRHPYIWASISTHAILFLVFFNYASHTNYLEKNTIYTEAQRLKVAESTEKTTYHAMQQHVEKLEKIEQLLAQSAGKNAPSNEDGTPQTQPDKQALLEKAKKLSENIETLRQEAKADELAALFNIPKEKALEKVKAEKAQDKKIESKKNEDPNTTLGLMEKEARKALQEREDQLARKENGTPIDTKNANNNQKGKGNGEQHGEGNEAAQENKAHEKSGGNSKKHSQQNTASNMTGNSIEKNDLPDTQEKIHQMLEDEIPLPENLGDNSNGYSDGGYGSIPVITDTNLIKISGSTIGNDGDFTNRFFVNSWYIIGPFSGKKNRIYNKNYHHPPEDAVLLDAIYEGDKKRLLTWEHHNDATYPVIPHVLEEDSIYYGYTEIKLKEDRDLWAWIGADDHVQLSLNNQLVYAGNPSAKMWFFYEVYANQHKYRSKWNLTETKKMLHFKKGINKLFFKLSNGPQHVFFSLVLTQNE